MARAVNAEGYKEYRQAFMLPPGQIVVDHKKNTRLYEPNVQDLVDSMLAEGQHEMVIVRPLPDGRFELVAGFRRWLAGKAIVKQQSEEGLPEEDRFKLKCDMRKVSSEEALLINISENAHRLNLSPVEEASTIQRLRNERGWIDTEGTQKIANLFRKSIQWVNDREEIWMLDEATKYQIHLNYTSQGMEGLSLGAAMVLAGMNEEDRQPVLQAAIAAQQVEGNDPAGIRGEKGESGEAQEVTGEGDGEGESESDDEAGVAGVEGEFQPKVKGGKKATTKSKPAKGAGKGKKTGSTAISASAITKAGKKSGAIKEVPGAKKNIAAVRDMFDVEQELDDSSLRPLKIQLTAWLNGGVDDDKLDKFLRKSFIDHVTQTAIGKGELKILKDR